jgi:hypothetical protein
MRGFPDHPEAFTDEIAELTERHLNPGLAKVLRFAGLGVEWYAEGCYIWDAQDAGFWTVSAGTACSRWDTATRRSSRRSSGSWT